MYRSPACVALRRRRPRGASALTTCALLATLAAAGCAEPPARIDDAPGAVSAVDDAGRTIRLDRPARRIISLLPAGTETLFALGAGDLVVGRTRYDTDPAVQHLPSVGGGLDPSLEALVALRPDLVVAWEPAGGGSRLSVRLGEMGIPVFSIQTRDTADIMQNMESLGRLTGRTAAADSVAGAVRAELDAVRASVPPGPRPNVLFVVSVDPPMTAGTGNFLAELIGVAGGDPLDVSADAPGLSPQVSLEELVRRDPDVVILPVSDDPSMTAERLARLPGWRELSAVRAGRVAEVPADLVNRPGPKIGEMARVLRDAIARAAEQR